MSWQPQNPWQQQQQAHPPGWTPPVPGAIPPPTAEDYDLAALSPFAPKVAAGLTAVAGLCAVLGSLQTWMTVEVLTAMVVMPVIDCVLGVGCIAVAVRLVSARRWAAVGALVLSTLLTLTSAVWCVYALANTFVAVFILLAPPMSLAATVVSALSLGPCDRAERARARLRAQDMDIGL